MSYQGTSPETLYLFEIEKGAEEARHGGVLGDGLLVFAHVGVFQQGVHAAQIRPRPSSARFGHGAMTAAEENGGEGVLDEQIALFVEGFLVQQVVVERVGEQFEIIGGLEVVELRDAVFRLQIEYVAGRQSYGQRKGQYD